MKFFYQIFIVYTSGISYRSGEHILRTSLSRKKAISAFFTELRRFPDYFQHAFPTSKSFSFFFSITSSHCAGPSYRPYFFPSPHLCGLYCPILQLRFQLLPFANWSRIFFTVMDRFSRVFALLLAFLSSFTQPRVCTLRFTWTWITLYIFFPVEFGVRAV